MGHDTMSEWKLKRFWTEVTTVPEEGGFAVLLDGRSVRTPAKTKLVVPTQGLADAVANEWAAQEGEIDPRKMPFTRTANAALDKVTAQHGEVAAMLADYGGTDLICYRAESPEGLVARQSQAWDPLIEWAGETFGARLKPTAGVMFVSQDPKALKALGDPVYLMSPFELAAFHDLVSMSGSLVIGLAVTRGFAEPEALWNASRVDEIWQEEQWGEDEEALQISSLKRTDFLHAAHVWALTRPSSLT